MNMRIKYLAMKLVSSKKRQALSIVITSISIILAYRLHAVWRFVGEIKDAVPSIGYLSYDSKVPGSLKFQVVYPAILSPISVGMSGIKGAAHDRAQDEKLFDFSMSDILINKQSPVIVDVETVFDRPNISGIVDRIQSGDFECELYVSCILQVRLCGLPLYFCRKTSMVKLFPKSEDGFDLSRYREMVRVETREVQCTGPGCKTQDKLEVKLMVDKMKLLDRVRAASAVLSSAVFNVSVKPLKIYTDLKFLDFSVDEFDLAHDTRRDIGLNFVVSRDSTFGDFFVKTLQSKKVQPIHLLGYEQDDAVYMAEEPVALLTGDAEGGEGSSDLLSQLAFNQRFSKKYIFFDISSKVRSNVFFLIKFLAEKSTTHFKVKSHAGLLFDASLVIAPLDDGQKKKKNANETKADPVPGGADLSLESFKGQENICTVRISKISFLNVLESYKRPHLLIQMYSRYGVPTLFNRFNIFVNEDMCVFLVHGRSVLMLSQGSLNSPRGVSKKKRTYSFIHDVRSSRKKKNEIYITTSLPFPSIPLHKEDCFPLKIPDLEFRVVSDRAKIELGLERTDLEYSFEKEEILGKLKFHFGIRFEDNGFRPLDENDAFGFFPSDARVSCLSFSKEEFPLWSLLAVLNAPAAEDGESRGERDELLRAIKKKQRLKGIENRSRSSDSGFKSGDSGDLEEGIDEEPQRDQRKGGRKKDKEQIDCSLVNWNRVGEHIARRIGEFSSKAKKYKAPVYVPGGGGEDGPLFCMQPLFVSYLNSSDNLAEHSFTVRSMPQSQDFVFEKFYKNLLAGKKIESRPIHEQINHVFVLKQDAVNLVLDGKGEDQVSKISEGISYAPIPENLWSTLGTVSGDNGEGPGIGGRQSSRGGGFASLSVPPIELNLSVLDRVLFVPYLKNSVEVDCRLENLELLTSLKDADLCFGISEGMNPISSVVSLFLNYHLLGGKKKAGSDKFVSSRVKASAHAVFGNSRKSNTFSKVVVDFVFPKQIFDLSEYVVVENLEKIGLDFSGISDRPGEEGIAFYAGTVMQMMDITGGSQVDSFKRDPATLNGLASEDRAKTDKFKLLLKNKDIECGRWHAGAFKARRGSFEDEETDYLSMECWGRELENTRHGGRVEEEQGRPAAGVSIDESTSMGSSSVEEYAAPVGRGGSGGEGTERHVPSPLNCSNEHSPSVFVESDLINEQEEASAAGQRTSESDDGLLFKKLRVVFLAYADFSKTASFFECTLEVNRREGRKARLFGQEDVFARLYTFLKNSPKLKKTFLSGRLGELLGPRPCPPAQPDTQPVPPEPQDPADDEDRALCDEILGIVRSLPLLNIDFVKLETAEDGSATEVHGDLYSADWNSLITRSVPKLLGVLPFRNLPKELECEVNVHISDALSVSLSNGPPVLGVKGFTLKSAHLYPLAYSLPEKDERKLRHRERKDRNRLVRRNLQNGFELNGCYFFDLRETPPQDSNAAAQNTESPDVGEGGGVPHQASSVPERARAPSSPFRPPVEYVYKGRERWAYGDYMNRCGIPVEVKNAPRFSMVTGVDEQIESCSFPMRFAFSLHLDLRVLELDRHLSIECQDSFSTIYSKAKACLHALESNISYSHVFKDLAGILRAPLRYSMQVPFIFRIVDGSSICLDLQLPVRVNLLRQTFTLSLFIIDNLIVCAKFRSNMFNRKSVNNGFSMTIPIRFVYTDMVLDGPDHSYPSLRVSANDTDYHLCIIQSPTVRAKLIYLVRFFLEGGHHLISMLPQELLERYDGLSNVLNSIEEFDIPRFYRICGNRQGNLIQDLGSLFYRDPGAAQCINSFFQEGFDADIINMYKNTVGGIQERSPSLIYLGAQAARVIYNSVAQSTLGRVVADAFDAASNAFSGAAEALYNAGSHVAEGVRNVASDAAEALYNAGSYVAEGVRNVASGAAETLYNAGSYVAEGLNNVKQRFGGAGTTWWNLLRRTPVTETGNNNRQDNGHHPPEDPAVPAAGPPAGSNEDGASDTSNYQSRVNNLEDLPPGNEEHQPENRAPSGGERHLPEDSTVPAAGSSGDGASNAQTNVERGGSGGLLAWCFNKARGCFNKVRGRLRGDGNFEKSNNENEGRPLPVNEQHPALGNEQHPQPDNEENPQSDNEQHPLPVNEQRPHPANEQHPELANEQHPQLGNEENPLPVNEQHPQPANEQPVSENNPSAGPLSGSEQCPPVESLDEQPPSSNGQPVLGDHSPSGNVQHPLVGNEQPPLEDGLSEHSPPGNEQPLPASNPDGQPVPEGNPGERLLENNPSEDPLSVGEHPPAGNHGENLPESSFVGRPPSNNEQQMGMPEGLPPADNPREHPSSGSEQLRSEGSPEEHLTSNGEQPVPEGNAGEPLPMINPDEHSPEDVSVPAADSPAGSSADGASNAQTNVERGGSGGVVAWCFNKVRGWFFGDGNSEKSNNKHENEGRPLPGNEQHPQPGKEQPASEFRPVEDISENNPSANPLSGSEQCPPVESLGEDLNEGNLDEQPPSSNGQPVLDEHSPSGNVQHPLIGNEQPPLEDNLSVHLGSNPDEQPIPEGNPGERLSENNLSADLLSIGEQHPPVDNNHGENQPESSFVGCPPSNNEQLVPEGNAGEPLLMINPDEHSPEGASVPAANSPIGSNENGGGALDVRTNVGGAGRLSTVCSADVRCGGSVVSGGSVGSIEHEQHLLPGNEERLSEGDSSNYQSCVSDLQDSLPDDRQHGDGYQSFSESFSDFQSCIGDSQHSLPGNEGRLSEGDPLPGNERPVSELGPDEHMPENSPSVGPLSGSEQRPLVDNSPGESPPSGNEQLVLEDNTGEHPSEDANPAITADSHGNNDEEPGFFGGVKKKCSNVLGKAKQGASSVLGWVFS